MSDGKYPPANPATLLPNRTVLLDGKSATVKAIVDTDQIVLFYIAERRYEIVDLQALLRRQPLMADE